MEVDVDTSPSSPVSTLEVNEVSNCFRGERRRVDLTLVPVKALHVYEGRIITSYSCFPCWGL